MEVTLSKYAGFCDGVDRAYNIVKKIADDPMIKKPIYVLGSLVHNEDVVKKIEQLGIGNIKPGERLEEIFEYADKKIGTLVITAHGMGPKIYELAKKKGVDIVDTTCPKVTKVQRLARVFFDRLYQIVIVGEKDHKEVKGIYEWAKKKAVFVENILDLKKLRLDVSKKVAIISQTTQSQDFVKKVSDFIRGKYSDVELVDTICLATQNRQNEVKELAKRNDAVIIIGSPESANSNRLWEISKKINSRSYFIQRKYDIKKEWFDNCQKIGVTAGASSPKWIIEDVMVYLKSL
ncbi:MAG: 4-hydroxy-3-methylbut-2-enyl diphosphate reductase [Candidatus Moranbacteria bacterium GW2011_GWE2_35_2-]|nr:MAG: 4-hydroxy-3-methylbut-2-enyl diphosphate reductase [Candidatus Moranbacteria bacterium GW2011_GWE2_35_2-]KKQ21815.1 MAG: 4-hydroxy-3-methylbut-2-enyl diphosphate reductase [Candidatus Moranbacteria bacterium GW2011_GWF2_37_11]KKQ28870.1 MAG: 4-hydroxy-3-methylbut-2-enyl diphosphate reductase [Candidatus Moranbacteria bacterium GW2011_GWD1_37_17]KKQ31053.1 MAG: 4-hydroxy-3-methylbut-2-enyl diphosphate reductase [Candidatus Moranbacteria bacterium GW2011_GWE1_37_24]KKQ48116.1 MAG: 4-hydro